jgi:hypothetical protein
VTFATTGIIATARRTASYFAAFLRQAGCAHFRGVKECRWCLDVRWLWRQRSASAIAGAAQAQGNGPGFHAAAFFDGACSAAFNQVVSFPTPPATAGPTIASCLSGTSAAAGEAAAAAGVRASTHQGGPGWRSTGRARIQIDNVLIVGPAAASIPVLDVDGRPTTAAPAIVRFGGVTGHFSIWGVALVTEGSIPTFAFYGLLPPYPVPPHTATPTFRLGRVVPLKFAWTDGGSALVGSDAAAPSVRIYEVSCSSLAPLSDAIAPEDAGESGGLRYDPETLTWIFNWSTRSLSAGCFSIAVSAGNGAFAAPASSFPVALRR